MELTEIIQLIKDFILIKGTAGQLFIILLNFLIFALLTKVHAERIENIFLLFLFYSVILFLEGLILLYLTVYGFLGLPLSFVFGILSVGILGIFISFLLNKIA